VSFSGIAGRILLSFFQNSYKSWKGKFFRVCCAKHDPTALDGFPLYWTEHPKLLKAKALDELSPADREICKALAGLGIIFDTLKLIACEYNAHSLTTYFGRETPLLLPSVNYILLHHAYSIGLFHLFSFVLSALCLIHLRVLWICITAFALTSAIWFV